MDACNGDESKEESVHITDCFLKIPENSTIHGDESFCQPPTIKTFRNNLSIAIKRLGELVTKYVQILLSPTNSLIRQLEHAVGESNLTPDVLMAETLTARYFMELSGKLKIGMSNSTNLREDDTHPKNLQALPELQIQAETELPTVKQSVISVPPCHSEGNSCINCNPNPPPVPDACHGVMVRRLKVIDNLSSLTGVDNFGQSLKRYSEGLFAGDDNTRRHKDLDFDALLGDWREDIMKSYSTKEISPPFSLSASSPSSDDFPWGTDSPEDALEAGVTSGLKWHPYILNNDRKSIGVGSAEWKSRIEEWSSYRTVGTRRLHEKRRSHYRSRRSSRERYAKEMKLRRTDLTIDWSIPGPDKYRLTRPEDIELPRLSRKRKCKRRQSRSQSQGNTPSRNTRARLRQNFRPGMRHSPKEEGHLLNLACRSSGQGIESRNELFPSASELTFDEPVIALE